MEIEYFINPAEKENCPFIEEVLNFELNLLSAEMQEKGEEAIKMKIEEALKKKIIKLSWHAYWLATSLKWFFDLGCNPQNFRVRQHLNSEKSHYATDTWDLEYKFPFGWKELQGISDRGVFDLTQHEKFSKKELRFFDEGKKEKILPMVVAEPSLGFERAFLVFMFDAFYKNEKGENILKLNSKLSPIKVAILPLMKKLELEKIAKEVFDDLKKEFNCVYDKSGSIGRRYARNDEVGTPFCLTIDYDSIKKKDVTIRDRNITKQVRVKISEIKNILKQLLVGEINFSSL